MYSQSHKKTKFIFNKGVKSKVLVHVSEKNIYIKEMHFVLQLFRINAFYLGDNPAGSFSLSFSSSFSFSFNSSKSTTYRYLL